MNKENCVKLSFWARGLSVLAFFVFAQPLLANPQAMVHVHYSSKMKVDMGGLTTVEHLKKTCDDMHNNYPTLSIPPFSITGNPKDLESHTEDVYISPENAYHATYKSGYKLVNPSICQFHIVPRQEKTILYYKQSISYRFDSSLPTGQQWLKSPMLGQKAGKYAAKTMIGLWGFTVKLTGKTDKIAGLFCEIGLLTTPKADVKSTSCVWRAKVEDNLKFLGYPLELILSGQSQIGKGVTTERVADSVNLREAYAAEVFQVPKNADVTSLDDIAGGDDEGDEPSDPHCLAEKKKTGLNPCTGPAEAAKWCKFELKRTGVDPCVEHADDDAQ